jgi:hypothetical protein
MRDNASPSNMKWDASAVFSSFSRWTRKRYVVSCANIPRHTDKRSTESKEGEKKTDSNANHNLLKAKGTLN